MSHVLPVFAFRVPSQPDLGPSLARIAISSDPPLFSERPYAQYRRDVLVDSQQISSSGRSL